MLPLTEMTATNEDCSRERVLPVVPNQQHQHSCLQRPSSVSEEEEFKDDEGGITSSPTEECSPEQHCNVPYHDYVETLAPVDSPKKDPAGWHHRGCRRSGRRRNVMFLQELLNDDMMGLTEMIQLTTKGLAVVDDDDMHAVEDDDGIGSDLFLDTNDTDLSPEYSDDDSNDDDVWDDDVWNDNGDDEIDIATRTRATTGWTEQQRRISRHGNGSFIVGEM
jgi:hypothetical protein